MLPPQRFGSGAPTADRGIELGVFANHPTGTHFQYNAPSIHGVGARPTLDNGGSVLDTLMVRKIDDLGRVVVPAETRRLFNIHEGDELAITVENGGIVLRKLDAICVFCGSEEGVADFEGRGVCKPCRDKISVL